MSAIPAAQYLRMSTEHQQYSLSYQSATIQEYAVKNGFVVVKTYSDAGKSGLLLKNRPGLRQLLKDVMDGSADYQGILVYDVSRWGRFQDADEAAHYEFLCRSAGKRVDYCAEPFLNDGTVPSSIMKAVKRLMAGEYSRDLSDRVFRGMKEHVKRGRWLGAIPGYGLRRMLLSPAGEPQRILNAGERKSLRSEQTTLVPGPPSEVACIREIYRLWIEEGRTAQWIADHLNKRHILRYGAPWSHHSILKVLKHEKYTGSLIWGRSSQKLHTGSVPLPRAAWTVVPNVFKPIVDRDTFNRAQQVLHTRTINQTDEELLQDVRDLLAREGRLSESILNRSRTAPSARCCKRRFGSLNQLYELVGYSQPNTVKLCKEGCRKHRALNKQVLARLTKIFGRDLSVIRLPGPTKSNIVRFADGPAVYVVVCPSIRTFRGFLRWDFHSHAAKRRGHLVLLCRCKATNDGFHDFYVLPNADNLPAQAHLQSNDKRLRTGKKLKRLADLRKVAAALAIQYAKY